jgi:phage host-nuclease inhibitor protein Gam
VGKFIPVEPEKWAEMVKAQAEVERLKMEQRLKAVPVEAKLLDRIAELKAEVERLTKAGDAVCESPYLWETDPAVIAWRNAKKGCQP